MPTAREDTSRLADLLRREHHALAEFLVALADFDARQGWSELEYASLFDYLHRELGLSRAAAFYRQTAARLLQRHPAIVEPLRDGRLCFSSVVELSKVLTAENLSDVLPRFFRLSKREAQEVRAELAPEPVVPRRAVVTRWRRDPRRRRSRCPREPFTRPMRRSRRHLWLIFLRTEFTRVNRSHRRATSSSSRRHPS